MIESREMVQKLIYIAIEYLVNRFTQRISSLRFSTNPNRKDSRWKPSY